MVDYDGDYWDEVDEGGLGEAGEGSDGAAEKIEEV